MSKASAIIRLPAGRRTKWAVLVFWLIIVAVIGPLAGKLTGAEKNDASAWLPAAAESTKVLDVQSRFQSPNIYAAVVVYDRGSGLTGADKAKAAADVRRFARRARAWCAASWPVRSPSGGRQGHGDHRPDQPRLEGLERRIGRRDQATGHRPHRRERPGSSTSPGPLGNAADSANAFKGIDGILLFADPGGRHRAAADHLPQPGAVAAAGHLGGGRAGHRAGTDLPAGQARGLTVNAQSAGILLVLVFGAGTDYALLLDRPLPRGAAPPRGPA